MAVELRARGREAGGERAAERCRRDERVSAPAQGDRRARERAERTVELGRQGMAVVVADGPLGDARSVAMLVDEAVKGRREGQEQGESGEGPPAS